MDKRIKESKITTTARQAKLAETLSNLKRKNK